MDEKVEQDLNEYYKNNKRVTNVDEHALVLFIDDSAAFDFIMSMIFIFTFTIVGRLACFTNNLFDIRI